MSSQIPATQDEYYLTTFDDEIYIDESTGEVKEGYRYPIIDGRILPLRDGIVRDTPRLIDPWFLYEAYVTRLAWSFVYKYLGVNGRIDCGDFLRMYRNLGTIDERGRPHTPEEENEALLEWGMVTDFAPAMYSYTNEEGPEGYEQADIYLAQRMVQPDALVCPSTFASDAEYLMPLTKDLLRPLYGFISQKQITATKSVGNYYTSKTCNYSQWSSVNQKWSDPVTVSWNGSLCSTTWIDNGNPPGTIELSSGNKSIGIMADYAFKLPAPNVEADPANPTQADEDKRDRLAKDTQYRLFVVSRVRFELENKNPAMAATYDELEVRVGIWEITNGWTDYPEYGQSPWGAGSDGFWIEFPNIDVIASISDHLGEMGTFVSECRTKCETQPAGVTTSNNVEMTLYMTDAYALLLYIRPIHTQFNYQCNQWNCTILGQRRDAQTVTQKELPMAVLTGVNKWGSVSNVLEVPMLYNGHVITGLGSLPDDIYGDSSGDEDLDSDSMADEVIQPVGLPEERAEANTDISTVILPASLEALGPYAFADTPNATTIIFKGALPTIAPEAFDDVALSNITIQVLRERSESWQTAIENQCLIDTDGNKIRFNLIELYAPSYTITFYAGDHGSFAGAESYVMYVKEGDPIIAPTLTTEAGYDFVAWDPEIPATATSDMTFTAQYEVQTCIWTFDAGAHGTFEGGVTQISLEFPYGYVLQPEDLPTVIPSGTDYVFVGWDVPATVTSDQTFTAQYTYTRLTWQYEPVQEGASEYRIIGVLNIPSDIEELVIPSSVTEGNTTYVISEVALNSTSRSYLTNDSNVSQIEMSYGIKRIGTRAFYGCNKIRRVKIPDSVIEVMDEAFSNVNSRAITTTTYQSAGTIPTTYAEVKSVDGWIVSSNVYSRGYVLTLEADQNGNLFRGIACQAFGSHLGGTGYIDSVDMTTSGIVGISAFGFNARTNFVGVSFSQTLLYIGESAFADCKNFASWPTLPSSVYHIGGGAFARTAITSAIIPNTVTSMGLDVFTTEAAYFPSNFSVSLPSHFTLANIAGQNVFRGSVTFTGYQNAPSIAASACQGYVGLRQVTLQDNVPGIGANAFNGCSSLEAVAISNDVKSIGDMAFANCPALSNRVATQRQTIDFLENKNNVSLGNAVFENSAANKNIALPHNETLLTKTNITSSGYSSSYYIWVPSDQKDAYESAQQQGDWTNVTIGIYNYP